MVAAQEAQLMPPIFKVIFSPCISAGIFSSFLLQENFALMSVQEYTRIVTENSTT